MRRPGVRLASVGLAIAVAGGVACSAINGNLPAPGSNTVAPTGPGGSPALNVKGQPQVGVAGNTSTADVPSAAQTAAPAAPPASARDAIASSRDASASASAPAPTLATSGAAATQSSASPALSTVEQSLAAQ